MICNVVAGTASEASVRDRIWRRECPSDTRPWLFHGVPKALKSLMLWVSRRP
jgi:hypothetical protein